jgi:tetratricopeptide (TPR) repeat protein
MLTAETLFNDGKRSFDSRGYSKALDLFNQCVAAKPDFFEAHFQKGLCLYEFLKLDAAISSFDEAIKYSPSYSDAYFAKARCLRNQGKVDEALSQFNKAIELDPSNTKALFQKGGFLIDLRRISEANECFQKVIKIDPMYDTAYYNLAMSYREFGRLDEALEYLNKAIEIKPGCSDYHSKKGRILYDLNKKDLALEEFTEAAKLKVDSTPSHQGRAIILMELGKLDDALTAIERAINHRPEFAYGHGMKGIILELMNKGEEAYKAVGMATKISTKDHFLQILKVDILVNLHHKDEELQEERAKLQEISKIMANDPSQVNLKSSIVVHPENEKRSLLEKFLFIENCLYNFRANSSALDKTQHQDFFKKLNELRSKFRKLLESTLYRLNFPSCDKDIADLISAIKALYTPAAELETELSALNPAYQKQNISDAGAYSSAMDLVRYDSRLHEYQSVASWTLKHFICYQKKISATYTSDPLLVKIDFCVTHLLKGSKDPNSKAEFAKRLFGDVDTNDEKFTREVSRISAELTSLRENHLDKVEFNSKKALTWIADQLEQGINLRKERPVNLPNAEREKSDLVDFVALLSYAISVSEKTAGDLIKAVGEALNNNDGFGKFIDAVEFEDKNAKTASPAKGDKKDKETPKKKACCTIF